MLKIEEVATIFGAQAGQRQLGVELGFITSAIAATISLAFLWFGTAYAIEPSSDKAQEECAITAGGPIPTSSGLFIIYGISRNLCNSKESEADEFDLLLTWLARSAIESIDESDGAAFRCSLHARKTVHSAQELRALFEASDMWDSSSKELIITLGPIFVVDMLPTFQRVRTKSPYGVYESSPNEGHFYVECLGSAIAS